MHPIKPSLNATAPKSKNWLLTKFRSWHTWAGIIAAIFLLVFGTTGIVLNYKNPIFEALGLEKPKETAKKATEGKPGKTPKVKAGNSGSLLSVDSALENAVTFEEALASAKDRWGDVPLENIQLKDERGQLIYKIKQKGGDELWVDATTGKFFLKAEYQKIEMAAAGKTTSFDWGKFFIDLHTGKIAGEFGKAIMSLAALVLLFLTASGIYLWTVPILRKRQSRNVQALAATAKTSTPVPSVKRNEELVRI